MITEQGTDYDAFSAALSAVTQYLSRTIAADGEGATKLILCKLTGASDKAAAVKLSKSVDQFAAREMRDVRRGRKLGPRALRAGLRGRADGREQSRSSRSPR